MERRPVESLTPGLEKEGQAHEATAPSRLAFFRQDKHLRYLWIAGQLPPFCSAQAAGKTDFDLLPRVEAEKLTRVKQAVLSNGKSAAERLRIDAHGELKLLEVVVEPFADANGELAGVVGSYRDISEESVFKNALAERFRQISKIFDSLEVLVYVAELGTHELLFINSYGKKLFGDAGLGKPCYSALQAGQAQPCEFCTNHLLVRDGVPTEPYVWEFQNTVTGRWFMCIDQAIRWTHGRLVRMEVAVDITRRKQAEQFREQFVGIFSHDLRNPLNVIALASVQLGTGLGEDGSSNDRLLLDRIRRSVERMKLMLDDLTESVRLESGQIKLPMERVELGSLLAGAAESLGQSGVDIPAFDFALPAGVYAQGNRAALERIVDNLLGNAVKYSPRESRIAVQVR